MTRALILTIAATAMAFSLTPGEADAGPKHKAWDRIEDRIDRRESYLDRQVDNGPRDRFEDRVDRWEDRRDRQGKTRPRALNKWERRSWRRQWGN